MRQLDGDFVPHTATGKIFTMVYILLGLGVLAVFVSTIAEHTLADQRTMAKRLIKGAAKDTKEGKADQEDEPQSEG